MAELVPFKHLVEGLAELFGMDEQEAINILLRNGIGSWRQFVRFLTLIRREDRTWKVD